MENRNRKIRAMNTQTENLLPITNGAEFGSALAREIKTYTSTRVVKPLEDRIAQLEAKIVRLEATLEARNFSYMGTWKEGKIYGPGSFVTHSGALWHSNIFHNTQRPGDGDASWTLCVKSGRDGRDASK
jgi:uncharacterized small protein (DUF1192 family)